MQCGGKRQGEGACLPNTGKIAKNTCQGVSACEGNSGRIGKNAWQGDRACFGNILDRAEGGCNEPPIGGVGVCEQ